MEEKERNHREYMKRRPLKMTYYRRGLKYTLENITHPQQGTKRPSLGAGGESRTERLR